MQTMCGGICSHYDCSNRNSFGYCKTTVCINSLYATEWINSTSNNSDLSVYKPQTNADRIRAMTDEELASGIWTDFGPNKWCKNYSGCTDNELCEDCILKWLKEEVSE